MAEQILKEVATPLPPQGAQLDYDLLADKIAVRLFALLISVDRQKA